MLLIAAACARCRAAWWARIPAPNSSWVCQDMFGSALCGRTGGSGGLLWPMPGLAAAFGAACFLGAGLPAVFLTPPLRLVRRLRGAMRASSIPCSGIVKSETGYSPPLDREGEAVPPERRCPGTPSPGTRIDIPGLGTATNLEAVGTTQNMKGEKMLDKMSARCAALSVASGEKKYIDGACVLTDSDGDQIFSTFDTRDTDKSQPQMNCGTHIVTGGTGKYKGITGSEPFACIAMPALAGPGGYTAMDIPHNTTWEIK